jgi:hypothetical protein
MSNSSRIPPRILKHTKMPCQKNRTWSQNKKGRNYGVGQITDETLTHNIIESYEVDRCYARVASKHQVDYRTVRKIICHHQTNTTFPTRGRPPHRTEKSNPLIFKYIEYLIRENSMQKTLYYKDAFI